MKNQLKKIALVCILVTSISSNLTAGIDLDWDSAQRLTQLASDKVSSGFEKLLPVNDILSLDMSSFKDILNSISEYSSKATGAVKENCMALVNYLKLKKYEMLSNSNSSPSVDTNFESIWAKASIENILGSLKRKVVGVIGIYLAYKALKYTYGVIKNKLSGSSNSQQNNNTNIAISIGDHKDKEEIKRMLLEKLDEIFKNKNK